MIGVIADDLTGAAELGAVGLRHGLRAEIVRRGQPSGQADLICVDTDSRSCDAGKAAELAAAAAKMLRAAGAGWIYKKVDSILRGQVTAEVEAVMKQLQFDRAVLLPANPSLGRIIEGGRYFVQGRPIHQTEFARDPEYPRRSSQVMRLLAAPDGFLLKVANGERSVASGAIVIAQASTPEDVRSWAEIHEETVLPAGGSEFFHALLQGRDFAHGHTLNPSTESSGANPVPDLMGNGSIDSLTVSAAARDHEHPSTHDTGFPSAPGPEFFISGTSTRQARQFVLAEKKRKVPVFTLPQELAWGADFTPAARKLVMQRVVAGFQSHSRVILAVGLPSVRDAATARKLSQNIVQVAAGVMQKVRMARVNAEGGATAAELVRRMGWSRLTVLREMAPGVATLAVDSGTPLLLTIKPGSYAWPPEWTTCREV